MCSVQPVAAPAAHAGAALSASKEVTANDGIRVLHDDPMCDRHVLTPCASSLELQVTIRSALNALGFLAMMHVNCQTTNVTLGSAKAVTASRADLAAPRRNVINWLGLVPDS